MEQDIPSVNMDLQYTEKENYIAGRISTKRLTVRQQVDVQIKELEIRIAALKNIKAKLDAAPAVEEVLDAMRAVGI